MRSKHCSSVPWQALLLQTARTTYLTSIYVMVMINVLDFPLRSSPVNDDI